MDRLSLARHLPAFAAFVLLAWLSYLTASGQPNFDLSVLRPTLIYQGLISGLALFYAGWRLSLRRLPGPTRLDLPILALMLVYAAAIAASVNPRVSWDAALLVAAPVMTFYACHEFDFVSPTMVARIMAGLGAVVAAIALFSVARHYFDWLALVEAVDGDLGIDNLLPPSVPRISGVGGHVNIIAMAFNLSLPFAGALWLRPVQRLDRPLGLIASSLVLLAIFFTVSRGAWIGTAAALAVFLVLYWLRQRELQLSTTIRIVSRLRIRALALVLVALIAVLAGAILAGSWESRPEWLFRSSLSPRYDAVSAGLQIFRDRPWLGAGPNTYPLLYSTYSGKYPVENIHPHNGYVAVLVDTGLAGALVLAAGGLVVIWSLVRAFVIGDGGRRTLVAACAAALASMAIHSLLETPNTWNTALIPLGVVLALSLRLAPGPAPGGGSAVRMLPRLTPLLLIAVVFGSWAFQDRAHGSYAHSLNALKKGDFALASRRAEIAADSDPSFAAYQLHAGVMNAISYLVQRNRNQAPLALLDESIRRSRLGLAKEPRSAIGYANLALALRLRTDAGDGSDPLRQEAINAARLAIARAPTDGTIAAVAGSIFEWAGLELEAGAAYNGALSHDAGLVQSPFWNTNEVRGGLRGGALEASALTACEKGRVTAIYRGYPDDLIALEEQCRVIVMSTPANVRARSDLAVILYALGRQGEARTAAQLAVRQVPDSSYARTALAITLMPEGDVSRIRHELLMAAYLGDPDAALLLAYTFASNSSGAGSAVIANLSLPQTEDPLPRKVVDRLKKAVEPAAPMVFDKGVQRYRLGVLYYRVRFLRESPTSILIPGDWLAFASPRALLILAEIEAATAQPGRR